MHPMAIMGIVATVGGLIAAAVALLQLYRYGAPLGPVFLGNGVPLLVLLLGMLVSFWQMRRGRRATPVLLVSFVAFLLTWWVINM